MFLDELEEKYEILMLTVSIFHLPNLEPLDESWFLLALPRQQTQQNF